MSNRISKAGSQVPPADLAELVDGNVKIIKSAELFEGRKVIVFALPGAFTPTCSTAHVPGYVAKLKDFKAAGIDDVVCLAVNDAFVMDAWQKAEKADGVRFIADPFGDFTEAMGMSVDHRSASLGMRSWRYSMLVDNGKIEIMFIEPDKPGDPFEVSDADTMWKYLRPNEKAASPAFMLARHGCPHCARAQEMLKKSGITFEAIYLGDELSMQGVKAASGKALVPQIFIEGKLIGGAEQLSEYLSRNNA